MSKSSYVRLCPKCNNNKLFQEREVERIEIWGRREPYEISRYKIKCKSCESEWNNFEIKFDEEGNVIGCLLKD